MKLNWRDNGRRLEQLTPKVLKRWTDEFDDPPKDGGVPAGILIQERDRNNPHNTASEADQRSPVPASQPLNGKPVHKSKPPNKPGNEVSAVRTTVRQFNLPNGYQTRDSRPHYGQNQVRYYDGPGPVSYTHLTLPTIYSV